MSGMFENDSLAQEQERQAKFNREKEKLSEGKRFQDGTTSSQHEAFDSVESLTKDLASSFFGGYLNDYSQLVKNYYTNQRRPWLTGEQYQRIFGNYLSNFRLLEGEEQQRRRELQTRAITALTSGMPEHFGKFGKTHPYDRLHQTIYPCLPEKKRAAFLTATVDKDTDAIKGYMKDAAENLADSYDDLVNYLNSSDEDFIDNYPKYCAQISLATCLDDVFGIVPRTDIDMAALKKLENMNALGSRIMARMNEYLSPQYSVFTHDSLETMPIEKLSGLSMALANSIESEFDKLDINGFDATTYDLSGFNSTVNKVYGARSATASDKILAAVTDAINAKIETNGLKKPLVQGNRAENKFYFYRPDGTTLNSGDAQVALEKGELLFCRYVDNDVTVPLYSGKNNAQDEATVIAGDEAVRQAKADGVDLSAKPVDPEPNPAIYNSPKPWRTIFSRAYNGLRRAFGYEATPKHLDYERRLKEWEDVQEMARKTEWKYIEQEDREKRKAEYQEKLEKYNLFHSEYPELDEEADENSNEPKDEEKAEEKIESKDEVKKGSEPLSINDNNIDNINNVNNINNGDLLENSNESMEINTDINANIRPEENIPYNPMGERDRPDDDYVAPVNNQPKNDVPKEENVIKNEPVQEVDRIRDDEPDSPQEMTESDWRNKRLRQDDYDKGIFQEEPSETLQKLNQYPRTQKYASDPQLLVNVANIYKNGKESYLNLMYRIQKATNGEVDEHPDEKIKAGKDIENVMLLNTLQNVLKNPTEEKLNFFANKNAIPLAQKSIEKSYNCSSRAMESAGLVFRFLTNPNCANKNCEKYEPTLNHAIEVVAQKTMKERPVNLGNFMPIEHDGAVVHTQREMPVETPKQPKTQPQTKKTEFDFKPMNWG